MTEAFLVIPDEILSVGEFSPSGLDTYRKCPLAWEFSYIKNLKHKGRKKHFDKGNYIHELMHVYNQLLQSGVEPGSDIAIASMRSRIAQDIQLATADNVDIYNVVSKLMASFIANVSPLIDAGAEMLAIEKFMKVPAVTPEGRTILLVGIVDLIYRLNGRIIVRDHKSSETPNSWYPDKVRASHQLLMYGALHYMETGEVPERVEVNFINSHNYSKPKPPREMFDLIRFEHTETSYKKFWESTLRRIDGMLDSPIEPHYSEDCARCSFWPICKLEIRGIDTAHLIKSDYEVASRDYVIRRKSDLSKDNSNGNSIPVLNLSPFGKR